MYNNKNRFSISIDKKSMNDKREKNIIKTSSQQVNPNYQKEGLKTCCYTIFNLI